MKDTNETQALGITSERQAQLDMEMLDKLFRWQPPQGDQPERYSAINTAALALAVVIHANCPPGPDRSDAIRKVREARMTANAAIATDGGFYR